MKELLDEAYRKSMNKKSPSIIPALILDILFLKFKYSHIFLTGIIWQIIKDIIENR